MERGETRANIKMVSMVENETVGNKIGALERKLWN
jgi:hypothetical protein